MRRDPLGLHPTGRILIYINNGRDEPVAAVTSLKSLRGALDLLDWPKRGLHVAREGVPLSVCALEALVEEFEKAVARG